MEEDIYLMDSEYCAECGCILDHYETYMCWDCSYDADHAEDDYYEGWDLYYQASLRCVTYPLLLMFHDERDFINEGLRFGFLCL